MQLEGFTDVSLVLQAGVYALCHNGEVVYVGKSKSMLGRIYSHRKIWGDKRTGKVPSWLPITGVLFDRIFVRPCRVEELDAIEREMIELYKPKHNVLLKTGTPVSLPESIRRRPEPIERRI